MSLKDKIAFVTGSSGGIGREICLSLAKQGVIVVQFGGSNKEKLTALQTEITALGGKSYIYPGNLKDESTLNSLFDKAVAEVGGVDILINNAGVALSCSLQDTPSKTFDDIMTINAKVPFLLIQKSLPYLKQSKRASIINIASVVAHQGYPLQSAYTASKHALLGLTKSLANEVYQDGIRVHAISPGGVFTDMIKISRPDLTGEGMIAPSEIADIVMFLLVNRGNAVIDEIVVHRLNKPPFLV